LTLFYLPTAVAHQAAQQEARNSVPSKAETHSPGRRTPHLLSQTISHYRIQRHIGTSVIGEVYVAEDLNLRRKVALTLLAEKFAQNAAWMRQLAQEARVLSALNHPNIRFIYEAGQDQNQHYIATEFVEGPTLREHLATTRMQLSAALETAVQIANGLTAAHAAGVLHRDLRPENVMLRPDGYVKILDFGLAKLVEDETPPAVSDPSLTDAAAPATETLGQTEIIYYNDPYQTAPLSQIKGLDAFMQTQLISRTQLWGIAGALSYYAPEHLRGEQLDQRSDIYSLGIVFYEMCAGRVPFIGNSAPEMLRLLAEQSIKPLRNILHNAPEELDWIMQKVLAREPEERYQTSKECLSDLRRLKQKIELAAEQQRVVTRSPQHPQRFETRPIERPPAFGDSGANQLNPSGRRSGSEPHDLYNRESGSLRRGSGARSLRDALDSLAVLPFVNVSSDPTTEYLSDGITETIISTLSRISDLRVMARSTVFKFKGRVVDPQAVGGELGVRGVLAGRVLLRGENLVVKVELVDAADGSLLWAESYQRPHGDIFELESEIAKQITEHLRLQLSGEQEEKLAKRYTDNAEAYHLYLKGRFFWNQRSPEALRKAIECFLQAIKKDNHYALAYAGMTDCYTLLSWAAVPPREFVPKARLAVMKALEIDDQLAEAHASLGFLTLWYDWDFLKAEQEFIRAIELNPNYPTAHHWYGYSLVVQERIDEGLDRMRHALTLDPLSLIITTDIGEILYRARRYEAALKQLQKAIEMDPHFQLAYSWRAVCLLKLGRTAEVIRGAEEGLRLFGGSPGRKTALAVACALANDRARAQMLFEQLQQDAQHEYVPPYYLACVAAQLGAFDQAFGYLERAYQERSGWVPWLKLDPMADVLRYDARYSDLMRRVGLKP
jgi:eukaryotic-like serine/threonine-protein kinase